MDILAKLTGLYQMLDPGSIQLCDGHNIYRIFMSIIMLYLHRRPERGQAGEFAPLAFQKYVLNLMFKDKLLFII